MNNISIISNGEATEYLCQKWPSICSVCRNHKPDLSSFMRYHLVCYKSIVSGAGTTTLAEHLGAPPVFSGVRVARSSISCAVFCRLLFVLFCHCIVCLLIFGCWLPLWCFWTFLTFEEYGTSWLHNDIV
jgi:hypothetical protein